ncbi:MAG: hypothetical protein AAGA71_22055 [Pseudomonadota bacterium]
MRERVFALATINRRTGIEPVLIRALPLLGQLGALAVREEGRVEGLAEGVMASYRAESVKTRRAAMAEFDRMLERARFWRLRAPAMCRG